MKWRRSCHGVVFQHGELWVDMKIAVIGAGIVGICTAYELVQDGHKVTVFERHAAVAEEASFACGGLLSPSLTHPLACPDLAPMSRMRALLAPSGLSIRAGTTWHDLRWLLAWKLPSKDGAPAFVSAQSLLAYSQQRLQALSVRAPLAQEYAHGQLLLFATEADQSAFQKKRQALHPAEAHPKALTPAQARMLEPALCEELVFHGALHFPNDAVGNCRQFAQLLRDLLVAQGAELRFSTPVTAIHSGPGVQVLTQGDTRQQFDQIVLCTGTGSTELQGAACKALPLGRVWSHSVSAPIREPLSAPQSAVLAHHQQVSISRMGSRIRVFGGAELGGVTGGSSAKTTRMLFHTLQNHFPGAADFNRSIQRWKGCSVFSPDALPQVGPSVNPGVWLNLAHGHNGWGMACGAARIIADQMAGRAADIDATKLHPDRFNS